MPHEPDDIVVFARSPGGSPAARQPFYRAVGKKTTKRRAYSYSSLGAETERQDVTAMNGMISPLTESVTR
jgi:hypothetical protein